MHRDITKLGAFPGANVLQILSSSLTVVGIGHRLSVGIGSCLMDHLH